MDQYESQSLDNLPNLCLFLIVDYLDVDDCLSLLKCNKRLKNIVYCTDYVYLLNDIVPTDAEVETIIQKPRKLDSDVWKKLLLYCQCTKNQAMKDKVVNFFEFATFWLNDSDARCCLCQSFLHNFSTVQKSMTPDEIDERIFELIEPTMNNLETESNFNLLVFFADLLLSQRIQKIQMSILRAFDLTKKAAKLGHPCGQIIYSFLLNCAGSVDTSFRNLTNIKKSIKYCKLAAKQRNPCSKYILYIHIFKKPQYFNKTFSNNYRKALLYSAKAVNCDLAFTSIASEYFFNTTSLFGKNESKAKEYYQIAANLGCATAMIELGSLHFNGMMDYPPNYIKAFSLFSQSARKGSLRAKYCLAICYEDGVGCERDLLKHFQILDDLAARNYPPSFFKLAHCYWQGFGCGVDYSKAIKYFEMAQEFDPDSENQSKACIYMQSIKNSL